MQWADFHCDCEHIDIVNTSDSVVDDLGPFKVKIQRCAPVSKDIVLETFQLLLKKSYLMPIEVVTSPKVTFRKLKIRLYVNYIRPRILWLGCRIRAPDLLF